MWCLSSDKKVYVNAQILRIEQGQTSKGNCCFDIVAWYGDEKVIFLGTYSTRKKADRIISELRDAVILDKGDFAFEKEEDIK